MRLYNSVLGEVLEVTWEEVGDYGEGRIRKYGLRTVGTRDYTFGYLKKNGEMVTESGYPLEVIDNRRDFPVYEGSQQVFEERGKSSFWDNL